MPIEPASEVFYNSLYRQRLDDKRRLQVPSKWKPSIEGFEFTVVIRPNLAIQKPYLMVLPPEQVKQLMGKFQGMSYFDTQLETLKRNLAKNSEQVVIDKAGRICLPEHMTAAAGIDKDVVLVGAWDRWEIWSPERYDAVSAVDDALSLEAMKLI